MITLTASNGNRGPWTVEDVLSLLDVRQPRAGLSVEERRRVDRFDVVGDDRTYFVGSAVTRRLLRSMPVTAADLRPFFGPGDNLIGGRAFMESEDLPDGFLFLCERNADERSRRDAALGMMIGAALPDMADAIAPEVVRHCARCGQDHRGMVFGRLAAATDQWTHWALCPRTRQPILMMSLPDDTDEPLGEEWLGLASKKETLTLAPAPPLAIGQNSIYVYWEGPKNSLVKEGKGWCACVNSAAFSHSVKLISRGHLRSLVRALNITEPADVLARLGVATHGGE